MLIAPEVFYAGATIALVIVFVTLAGLQHRLAEQREKNRPVKLTVYRNNRHHEFAFFTIREAAVSALRRQAKGEGVAYIEADRKTVWISSNEESARSKLEELAK